MCCLFRILVFLPDASPIGPAEFLRFKAHLWISGTLAVNRPFANHTIPAINCKSRSAPTKLLTACRFWDRERSTVLDVGRAGGMRDITRVYINIGACQWVSSIRRARIYTLRVVSCLQFALRNSRSMITCRSVSGTRPTWAGIASAHRSVLV